MMMMSAWMMPQSLAVRECTVHHHGTLRAVAGCTRRESTCRKRRCKRTPAASSERSDGHAATAATAATSEDDYRDFASSVRALFR